MTLSMRILAAILGVLVGLFTLATAAMAFQVLPIEQLTAMLVSAQAFFASSDANLLIGLIGVAALLTVSGLGIGALIPRRPRGFRYRISEGEVIVPKRLVEEIAADTVRDFPGMVRAEVRAEQRGRGARLVIQLLTHDGSSINASVDDLKDHVRRAVENQTGIQVGEIRMTIRLVESRDRLPATHRRGLGGRRAVPAVEGPAAGQAPAEAEPDGDAAPTKESSGQESGTPRPDPVRERIVRPLRADPDRRVSG